MTIRAASYALTRQVPYLLERGALQTLEAPIRHGKDGSLQAPDAGGTITILKPNAEELVSAQTITVSGGQATYALTPATTLALGAGYEVRWSLSFGGVAYPAFRLAAYLCEYVPHCPISVLDLFGGEGIPELKYRVPQAQGSNGDDVGWQPQVDAAYFAFLRMLFDNGQKPWLLREATGYRQWVLTRALTLCVQGIQHGADSDWAQHAKAQAFAMKRAQAGLRLQYSDDDASYRRGGSPLIRLSPAGRLTW